MSKDTGGHGSEKRNNSAIMEKIRFDLRAKSEGAKRGVGTTGRLGGYEKYETVKTTKRTMARWARKKRGAK